MRCTMIVAAILALALGGCRGWPEMAQDTQQLQAILRVYRDETMARTPTHTADVERLGAKLDSIAGHMGDLAR